ncbi:hypothetical protein [Crateriforma spongiae]|uniref:hypothetical protein n=1 Tax=Crateriforma spongiae TaxID=2724528 RepID=UPI0014476425|nr:hypothetical protein [Crateriforma spongiae]
MADPKPSESNPQIDELFDELAELCCQCLQGDQSHMADRSEALLKSLIQNGYARKDGSIQAEIESRAKDGCRESAMHRGGELSGLTKNLQDRFDRLAKWNSDNPPSDNQAKAANISSATDA